MRMKILKFNVVDELGVPDYSRIIHSSINDNGVVMVWMEVDEDLINNTDENLVVLKDGSVVRGVFTSLHNHVKSFVVGNKGYHLYATKRTMIKGD